MDEPGGLRRHCRGLLLRRGDIFRTRSAKRQKSRTTRDGRWRIGLLHPMPSKDDYTPRSAPTSGRLSSVSRHLQPRCAAGSIQGTAPARWPDCKIRLARSSQGLAQPTLPNSHLFLTHAPRCARGRRCRTRADNARLRTHRRSPFPDCPRVSPQAGRRRTSPCRQWRSGRGRSNHPARSR